MSSISRLRNDLEQFPKGLLVLEFRNTREENGNYGHVLHLILNEERTQLMLPGEKCKCTLITGRLHLWYKDNNVRLGRNQYSRYKIKTKST